MYFIVCYDILDLIQVEEGVIHILIRDMILFTFFEKTFLFKFLKLNLLG